MDCEGRTSLKTVQAGYSNYELTGLLDGLVTAGKRSAKKSYLRRLKRREEEHEDKLHEIQAAWVELESINAEQLEVSQREVAALNLRLAALPANERKKSEAEVRNLEQQIEQLQIRWKDLSEDTKKRIREDMARAHEERQQQITEKLCSCHGSNENCARCSGRGAYKVDGNDSVVG